MVPLGTHSSVCGYSLWGVHDAHILYSRQFFTGNPTERQLWQSYDKFGASPRDLIRIFTLPDQFASRLKHQIDTIKPADLRDMFNDPSSHPASHLIVTLHPSSEARSEYIAVPASLYVFGLLAKKHLLSRIDDSTSTIYSGEARSGPLPPD